jgi:hypothetical protein
MQLPFTSEQFFDLFAAYNAALWPVLLALWITSAIAAVLLVSGRRPSDRWISALLAAHWMWSAVAYHAVFFTRINPAAWLFAVLFIAERCCLRGWESSGGVYRLPLEATRGPWWGAFSWRTRSSIP